MPVPPAVSFTRPSPNMVDSMDSIQVDEEDFLLEHILDAGDKLLTVVESGDLEAVKAFVKSEQPPMFFQHPESGWSSLHTAASIENAEIMAFLLEEGAVWNAGEPSHHEVDSPGGPFNEPLHEISRFSGKHSWRCCALAQ